MSNPRGTRPPPSDGSDGSDGDGRVARLPDRRRAVAESPELDRAISELMDLARFVKIRRFRGPLGPDETAAVLAAVAESTEAFTAAVCEALDIPPT